MNDQQIGASWPIVCSPFFKDRPIAKRLGENHRVKFSESILQQTIIFPLSSIAFMVINLKEAVLEWPPQSGKSQLVSEHMERLMKFSALHRNCYLLLLSAIHGANEWKITSDIQARFLDTQLQIIPTHSEDECVQVMSTIAKATCKPACAILRSRLNFLLSQQQGEEKILEILSKTGLCEHDCLVLQQGCETLGKIAQASKEELLNCSLDSTVVESLQTYFQKDSF